MSDEPKRSWLGRLRAGLGRSASKLGGGIADIVRGRRLDATTLTELEDALIAADLGPTVAARLAAALQKSAPRGEVDDAIVRGLLASEIAAILAPVAQPLEPDPASSRRTRLLRPGGSCHGQRRLPVQRVDAML